jgi:hypothetical protein
MNWLRGTTTVSNSWLATLTILLVFSLIMTIWNLTS